VGTELGLLTVPSKRGQAEDPLGRGRWWDEGYRRVRSGETQVVPRYNGSRVLFGRALLQRVLYEGLILNQATF
jgi:hypothetical protein